MAAALAEELRKEGWQAGFADLHRIASEEDLDEAARFLLAECVEDYVQLNDAEEREYRSLLSEEANREVATMEMTRSERLRQEARMEGRKEGEHLGYLKGMQTLLLDMLRQRFGNVSPATERQIRAVTSAEELSRLAGEVVAGRKPPELGL